MKQILILILLLAVSILAEENIEYSQATLRMERKRIIEVNTWQATCCPNLGLGLNFQYNFNKFASIGFNNKLYRDNVKEFNESLIVPGLSEINYTTHLTFLYARLFPFESFPVYFDMGLGRDLYGKGRSKELFLGIYSSSEAIYIQKFRYTEIDFSPTNFGIVGFGFQWINKIGLVINLGYLIYIPSNRIRNVHTFEDINATNPDLLLYSYVANRRVHHNNIANSEINLGIGYAF